MADGNKQRQSLVSRLLPIAEHRQSKVCDSSALNDSTVVAVQAKPGVGYGRKVVRPFAKMKKAFVTMLVKEGGETCSATNGTSSYPSVYQASYSIGMGMIPAIGTGYYSAGYA